MIETGNLVWRVNCGYVKEEDANGMAGRPYIAGTVQNRGLEDPMKLSIDLAIKKDAAQ